MLSLDQLAVFFWGVVGLAIVILLYDARPLIMRPVGRIELVICCIIAAVPVAVLQADLMWNVIYGGSGWGELRFLLITLSMLMGVALIGIVYGLHWGISKKWISAIVLRLGMLTWTIPTMVPDDWRGTLIVLNLMLAAITAIYLIEVVLYARTGWKERIPNETI